MQQFFTLTWLLFCKDMRLEGRDRSRLHAMFYFAALTLLLFSFAVGPNHFILSKLSSGFLWLAVLLASLLRVNGSMQHEQENNAIEGLRLLRIDMRALFVAKAALNSFFLAILAIILVPLLVVLYGVEIRGNIACLPLIILLGSSALGTPATIYASMAMHAKSKDVLLPMLLFPIVVPSLLALVRATDLVLLGDGMNELKPWLQFLCGVNAIYWALGLLLFGRIFEESA